MKSSREKGKAGEREAAHFLADLFKLPCRRGQQYQGGPESPDVAGLDGLHIEVKRVEKLQLDAALEQSARDAGTNELPLVLHRSNRKRWKITLYAEDVIRFVDAAGELIDRGHALARDADNFSAHRVVDGIQHEQTESTNNHEGEMPCH